MRWIFGLGTVTRHVIQNQNVVARLLATRTNHVAATAAAVSAWACGRMGVWACGRNAECGAFSVLACLLVAACAKNNLFTFVYIFDQIHIWLLFMVL